MRAAIRRAFRAIDEEVVGEVSPGPPNGSPLELLQGDSPPHVLSTLGWTGQGCPMGAVCEMECEGWQEEGLQFKQAWL